MKQMLVDGSNMQFHEGVQQTTSGAPSDQVQTGKNMKKTWIRWLMLFMACCFLLGSYYCFDNPSVLEK